MAIFKNESHILEEWIEHYIQEGVDFFYLINNNSTDQFMNIIDKYKDKICLYNRTGEAQQHKHYNSIVPDIKKDTEWLLVCDLDEFVFATKDFEKIPDVIKKFLDEKEDVTQICLPWKNFSSNKHIEQPKSVIEGFTDRRCHEEWEHRNKKYMVLVDCLQRLDLHGCKRRWGISVDPKNRKPRLRGRRLYINEEELEDHSLHLNHYPIQSYNWFMKVKATRGSVRTKYNVRNEQYFAKYDEKYSGYEDNLLKNKRKAK